MPEQYESIKSSYAKDHPKASEKDVKKHAAMIFIAKGKGGSRSSRAKSLHADSPAAKLRSSKKHKKNTYRGARNG